MTGSKELDMVIVDNVINMQETYGSIFNGEVAANYYFRNNTLIGVYARKGLFDISIANVLELNDTYVHSCANHLQAIFNILPLHTKSLISVNRLHIYNNSFSNPSFVVLSSLTENKAISFTNVFIYDNSKLLILNPA